MNLKYPERARTFDELGNYFKECERNFTLRKFIPNVPIVARLDIRAAHSFCKGLEKPYSQVFMDCMKYTCLELGKEFNPMFLYAQSDELTICFHNSPLMFDGTVQKYISNLSAYASVMFNKRVRELIPSHVNKSPTFDCRVFQVSSIQEVFDNVVWRQIDAMKNSVSLLACNHFSPKELSGKSTKDRKEMLANIGVDWNIISDTNQQFARGAFFKRKAVDKKVDFPITDKILAKNPNISKLGDDYYVRRNEWNEVIVPRLSKITEDDEALDIIEQVFSNHIMY